MKKRTSTFFSFLMVISFPSASIFLATSDARAEEKKQIYTCPMHPDVKSEEPGDCPICHMKLMPIPSTGESGAKSPAPKTKKKIKFYRNPMNPAVTSKTPAKDEMGMEYIPVFEDETSAEIVAGRSAFELTPAQVSNLQLKSVKVETKPLTERLKASARMLNGSSVAIQVMESDASKVKEGLKFSFKSLSQNAEFQGKLIAVDSALDPMSRTVRVTGLLTKNSGLRSESSGTAVIEINMGSGLLVPENAVIRTGEVDLVYIVSGNRISPRKVQLGVKVDGGFQVLSGIGVEEEISTGPNFLLDSEARIRSAHD